MLDHYFFTIHIQLYNLLLAHCSQSHLIRRCEIGCCYLSSKFHFYDDSILVSYIFIRNQVGTYNFFCNYCRFSSRSLSEHQDKIYVVVRPRCMTLHFNNALSEFLFQTQQSIKRKYFTIFCLFEFMSLSTTTHNCFLINQNFDHSLGEILKCSSEVYTFFICSY